MRVGNIVMVGEQRRANKLIYKLILSERDLRGAAL